MKFIVLVSTFFFSFSLAFCQLPIIKSIGPAPSDFVSLTSAIASIQTSGIDTPTIFELKSNYASSIETFPLINCIAFEATQSQKANINSIGINPEGEASKSFQNKTNVTGGGSLTVEGTLILKGNLVNQNVESNLGPGIIEFSGTSAQNISGQNSIGTLSVNNPLGLDLNGNTTVNTSLNLQNGHIRLATNNLTLGSAASIAGTPSASAMVIATGTGELRKKFSAPVSFTYPVGDNTGITEYTPVTLSFTSASFALDNYVGVRLSNSAFPGLTGNYLNRVWSLSQSGISSAQFDAIFQYVLADIVGSENGISCTRVEPSPAASFNPANTILHQLSATGLTSFGTFTGAPTQSDRILKLNFYLEGLYAGNGLMNKAMNGSVVQFSGNIADMVSIELHEGTNYNTLAFTKNNVGLSTNGLATLSVPTANNSSYYVTVKHRNSLATTSKLPIAFSGDTVSYNFNTQLKAYGNNLKLMSDGYVAIFGGDPNQDGKIDALDINMIGSQSSIFGTGYRQEDVNGDGMIDALDLILPDNNAARYVMSIFP